MICNLKIIKLLAIILFFAGSLVELVSCKYYNEEELYPPIGECDTTNVTYTTAIAPIFEANCYVCHSTAIASGGIILDNYQDAIIPAQNGLMWKAVSHEPGFPYWMPKDLPQLPQCELDKIRIWIAAGVPQ